MIEGYISKSYIMEYLKELYDECMKYNEADNAQMVDFFKDEIQSFPVVYIKSQVVSAEQAKQEQFNI